MKSSFLFLITAILLGLGGSAHGQTTFSADKVYKVFPTTPTAPAQSGLTIIPDEIQGLQNFIKNLVKGCQEVHLECNCKTKGMIDFTRKIPAPVADRTVCLSDSQWDLITTGGLGQGMCASQSSDNSCELVSASCTETCYNYGGP